MTRGTHVGIVAVALVMALAGAAFAAEDVTEHETYEKRSMKVETVPAMPTTTTTTPGRVYERREESTTVERRSDAPPPPPVVQERQTETIERR